MIVQSIPLEVWTHIGQQVTQERQRTLRSLSETCHFFHRIFTPLLFSSLRLTGFEELILPLGDFAECPHLRHVRRFTVIAGSSYAESFEPEAEASLYGAFNRNLIDCLKSMPNLVSFTLGLPGPWKTHDEQNDGVNGIPLFDDLLHALHVHTPKLHSLTLCVPYIPESDDEWNDWSTFVPRQDIQPFVEFRNMTSLVLIGEFAFPTGIAPLVTTLLQSPRLVDLHLDLQHVALSSICTQYADSGGQPLALKRLGFSDLNPRSHTDWSCLGKLADLQKLECLEVDLGTPRGNNVHPIYVSLADPAYFSCLRRLSLSHLDKSGLSVIRTVGQSLTVPPFFLSELFFQTFDWDMIKDGFNTHPQKRLYWPTCFVLGQNTGSRSTPEVQHGLVDEISAWQGLRLLHLALDMDKDRSHLVKLTDSLCTNLRELYVTEEDSSSTPDDDDEYGSEREFAERLCAKSRISYLVVYQTGYRVVRGIGEEVRLEVVAIAASEVEEAEILMLYRERTEV